MDVSWQMPFLSLPCVKGVRRDGGIVGETASAFTTPQALTQASRIMTEIRDACFCAPRAERAADAV